MLHDLVVAGLCHVDRADVDAVAEDRGPVAESAHLIHAVRDEDDRHALVAQAAHDGRRPAAPGRRLSAEVASSRISTLRLAAAGLGDLDQLAVGEREIAHDGAGIDPGEAETRQQRAGLAAACACRRPDRVGCAAPRPGRDSRPRSDRGPATAPGRPARCPTATASEGPRKVTVCAVVGDRARRPADERRRAPSPSCSCRRRSRPGGRGSRPPRRRTPRRRARRRRRTACRCRSRRGGACRALVQDLLPASDAVTR